MGEALGRGAGASVPSGTSGPARAALAEVRSRLGSVRERWRAAEIVEKLLLWTAVLAATVLAVSLIELLLRPGVAIRLVLFTGLVAAAAGWLAAPARALLRHVRDEAVARRVERALPELGNALINAIELGRDELGGGDSVRGGTGRDGGAEGPRRTRLGSSAMAEAAIIQSRDRWREVRLERAVSFRRAARTAPWTAAACAALALAFVLAGGPLSSALLQVVMPLSFVPVRGAVRIVSVKPGDAKVRAGAQVPIEVEIARVKGAPPAGTIFHTAAGSAQVEKPMTPLDRTHYGFTLSPGATARYRVEVGGTQSRVYTLELVERAAVERVDIELAFPDYARREPELIENATDERLDVRAPVGTVVRFTVRTNRSVRSASLEIAGTGSQGGDEGREIVTLETVGKRTEHRGAVRLDRPSERRYAIRLVDDAGASDDSPVWHLLAGLPDEPPRVSFLAPARNLELSPGGKLPLVVRATDDFGLTRVEVRYRRNKEGEERVLRAWKADELGGRAGTALAHDWPLARAEFEAGDIVTYHAIARDRLSKRSAAGRSASGRANMDAGEKPGGPAASAGLGAGEHEGRSSTWEVRLVDPAEKIAKKVSALEELLKAVEEMAALQERARTDSRKLASQRKVTASLWKPVAGRQAEIRGKATSAVAASERSAEADAALVRAVVRRLAAGEMARAAVIAEHLAAGSAEATPEMLDRSQTAILTTLRRLLGILPKAIERAKTEELPDEEGSDLPDEAAERLKDLAEQLKEFMDEQRKVISSTEDLAKMPVEDFTEEDKAKQEALAAIEEKWEKFMKEAASDLSKVPIQDFASEQLLSELIEVFSEVEMAKDALTKKSAEIAVPIEQAGLEKAEELTTHLEKWLPDTPDRQQWSMEEPLGETEVPAAELPSELEDIVGELMEGAEDIFEEMEDVTSNWMDSLDKGAGWDAMDGPISNMSAQGVTGNHLPNSSEIGGRSGEGRTGRASGEMVEDSATGKGGRQTPTRLTPDAFLGEEIKDTSKDPAGGATGGGKLSGAGGEGLEGPVPPELKREMERLKGAQASLRNRAERVAMELRARNFPEADIEVTLAQIRAMEADLKDGRYANIARRRNVLLEGLERSREFVEGTARVELDRSRGPEGFDEEVGSARDEVDPEGFEALLRAYREAIRAGGQ